MDYILYFFRFLYRIRWWLLTGTIIVALIAVYLTRNLSKSYRVEATVYTGIISGYSLEGQGQMDWAATINAIDNLITIMKAESTLKRVSYRLYARNMIHGNQEKDNAYLTAESFREIYNRTKNNKDGKALLALIDKNDEAATVANMLNYEQPTPDNFIYGLFYWNHWHYSYEALKKINVARKGNSDLLQISYSSNDPGIAYNTIILLMEEFVREYRTIRYEETDKVIEYFRGQLAQIGSELRIAEDSLTQYNVEKRIINYYDETKEIAAINKEFELREQDVLLDYNSARAQLGELERQLDINMQQLKTNAIFVDNLHKVSNLTSKITELESFATNNSFDSPDHEIEAYKAQLKKATTDLSVVSDQYVQNGFTKEGIAKSTVVEQWLEQLLLFEKAKAQLEVIQKSRNELNDKYLFFAPVGSTIKRKERSITFSEQNYLTVHKSYNDALLRKRNLEMTSATLKVLNPPAYPIAPEPGGRKRIVIIAALAGFFFILGFFLLVEMLDRTLRDKIRAERIIGSRIIGAFPARAKLKYRNYNNMYIELACKYLSGVILGFCNKKRENNVPYIINFLSTEPGDGKSYLSNNLVDYWTNMGMKARKISWDADFDINDRKYLLANSVSDLYTPADEDIIIVEYPSLKDHSVSTKLLEQADLNLMIVRADRSWKDSDKMILDKLKGQVKGSYIHFYLNKTSIEATQIFTGMLPPYTYLRKFGYRLSQLGLTEHPIKEEITSAENENE